MLVLIKYSLFTELKMYMLVSEINYVMLCYVCYVMLCYVMLCYVMLCYVMLCYVMLCTVMIDEAGPIS